MEKRSSACAWSSGSGSFTRATSEEGGGRLVKRVSTWAGCGAPTGLSSPATFLLASDGKEAARYSRTRRPLGAIQVVSLEPTGPRFSCSRSQRSLQPVISITCSAVSHSPACSGAGGAGNTYIAACALITAPPQFLRESSEARHAGAPIACRGQRGHVSSTSAQSVHHNSARVPRQRRCLGRI